MRSILISAGILAASAAFAVDQPPPLRVQTTAKPLSREVLDRLNLKQAWKQTVPLQGRRDGIFSIQILGEEPGTILAVQTISGALLLLDGETGDQLWRIQLDQPFVAMQPIGTNGRLIFASRREQLYILDRATGRHMVWTVHKDSGIPTFGYRLEGPPAAAPAADESLVYISYGDKVSVLTLAGIEGKGLPDLVSGVPPAPGLETTAQPRLLWNQILVKQQVMQPALPTAERVCVMATDGTFTAFDKFRGDETAKFKLHGPLQGAVAQVRGKLYAGSEDYFVYSLDLAGLRLNWRFSTGSPILKPVQANDRDVYVVPEKVGLSRVDREEGRLIWSNPAAQRLLASNDRFVYATDRHENLLVLDFLRGTTMATLDNHDYMFPVSNTWTDRIYLANHDGHILCLHHRDLPRPLILRQAEKKPKPKPPDEKKEPLDPDKEKIEKDKVEKEKIEKGSLEALPANRGTVLTGFSFLAPLSPRLERLHNREDFTAGGEGLGVTPNPSPPEYRRRGEQEIPEYRARGERNERRRKDALPHEALS